MQVEPESARELDRIAELLLDRADVVRRFPTPIDDILAAAGVTILGSEVKKSLSLYLSLASAEDGAQLQCAWAKLRGFADTRSNAMFVDEDGRYGDEGEASRRRARLHEGSHLAIPWHNVRQPSDQIRRLFDAEADYLADELLFQGGHFRALAGSMFPNIDSVVRLADLYGAPLRDTALRFSRVRRQPLFVIVYRDAVASAQKALLLNRTIATDESAFADLVVPEMVHGSHPWIRETTNRLNVLEQELALTTGHARRFQVGLLRRENAVLVSLRPTSDRYSRVGALPHATHRPRHVT